MLNKEMYLFTKNTQLNYISVRSYQRDLALPGRDTEEKVTLPFPCLNTLKPSYWHL